MTGRRRGGLCAVPVLLLVLSCASGPPGPARIDTRHDACAHCRMTVSDPRLAGQIVAPGEEAKIFDDLGCLRDYLIAGGPLPEGAVIFVADHRTGDWIRADRALVTRGPYLATPMDSHLLAHLDTASRDQDPDARDGETVPTSELLAGRWPAPGVEGGGP